MYKYTHACYLIFLEIAQYGVKTALPMFKSLLKYLARSPIEKLKIVSFGDIEKICNTIKEDTKHLGEDSFISAMAGVIENWAGEKKDKEDKMRKTLLPSAYRT